MNYKEFVSAMLECVKDKLPETKLVEKQEVLKNNGVISVGISIRDREDYGAPIIYLEEFFGRYCDGEDIESLAEILIGFEKAAPEFPAWDYKEILDFQKIKHRIAYKLVNTEKNQKLLEDVPNLPMMDLSIVFYAIVDSGENQCSVLIRNAHRNYWKLPISKLYECARENTPKLCPVVIRPLGDYLNQYTSEKVPSCPLNILSNESGLQGAAAILYPKIPERIHYFMGRNYYLLPSSIHEFLILPEDERYSAEELKAIVREVNCHHVAKEDFLSDNIYYFNGTVVTKI